MGLTIPKLFIVDFPVLNALMRVVLQKTYAISLTTGLIEKLEKDELETVIAHGICSHYESRYSSFDNFYDFYRYCKFII